MKNKNHILMAIAMTIFYVLPTMAQEFGQAINGWTETAKTVAQAVIGLAAVGGGLYAYFKVQTDDGGQGKKAIGNFVLALIFGAVVIGLIEFFLGDPVTIARPY